MHKYIHILISPKLRDLYSENAALWRGGGGSIDHYFLLHDQIAYKNYASAQKKFKHAILDYTFGF